MQSTIKLKISPVPEVSVQVDSALVLETIQTHAEQVAYMLQAYHIREKVSRVTVVPDSLSNNVGVITLKIQYVLEEFSACSAIDTLQKEKMTVTVYLNEKAGELELTGEYWPERDPD